ncbi:peroxisomal membrane protein 2 isoform X3 [Phacochoerus africanus]|uniref:peroxisomal membrane protein 2 isoform X3 n=1 Tax=Phacochoerus africanus TaxID=41426 RepID=UPI001FD8A094|nr:peroxisomal membrane protein 2 isoform X3 [Phacochoerus africanus]
MSGPPRPAPGALYPALRQPTVGSVPLAGAAQERRWPPQRRNCGPKPGSGRSRGGRSPSTCAFCGSTRCSPRRPPGERLCRLRCQDEERILAGAADELASLDPSAVYQCQLRPFAVPGAFCQRGGSVLVCLPGLSGEVKMSWRECQTHRRSGRGTLTCLE